MKNGGSFHSYVNLPEGRAGDVEKCGKMTSHGNYHGLMGINMDL